MELVLESNIPLVSYIGWILLCWSLGLLTLMCAELQSVITLIKGKRWRIFPSIIQIILFAGFGTVMGLVAAYLIMILAFVINGGLEVRLIIPIITMWALSYNTAANKLESLVEKKETITGSYKTHSVI